MSDRTVLQTRQTSQMMPNLSVMKRGYYLEKPQFSWNYGYGTFVQYLANVKKSSSIKPLTRNHSFLV